MRYFSIQKQYINLFSKIERLNGCVMGILCIIIDIDVTFNSKRNNFSDKFYARLLRLTVL